MAIQHSPEFILEGSFSMMFFLIPDVGLNRFLHGETHRKCSVFGLPSETVKMLIP